MGNKFSRKKTTIQSGASDEEIRQFLKNVRPLDLLVFCGNDGVSKFIRRMQSKENGNGDISHVETAITREWCTHIAKIKTKPGEPGINDNEDTLLSWGSTMSGNLSDGVKSVETGEAHFGVQIRVLHDLVKHYLLTPGANVGVCRLLNNPTLQRPGEPLGAYNIRKAALIDSLNSAYDKFNGNRYNANVLALLGAVYPNLRCARDMPAHLTVNLIKHNPWLFCSEFVASVYIEVGIITDETDGAVDGKVLNPADVVPVDFTGYDVDESGINVSICDSPIWIKQKTVKETDIKDIVMEFIPLADLVEAVDEAPAEAEKIRINLSKVSNAQTIALPPNSPKNITTAINELFVAKSSRAALARNESKAETSGSMSASSISDSDVSVSVASANSSSSVSSTTSKSSASSVVSVVTPPRSETSLKETFERKPTVERPSEIHIVDKEIIIDGSRDSPKKQPTSIELSAAEVLGAELQPAEKPAETQSAEMQLPEKPAEVQSDDKKSVKKDKKAKRDKRAKHDKTTRGVMGLFRKRKEEFIEYEG